MSSQPPSPRRVRAKKLRQAEGAAPRRIEELDVDIQREPESGRLGFGIDAMNTIVEVDPNGPVAGKLQVGTHTNVSIYIYAYICVWPAGLRRRRDEHHRGGGPQRARGWKTPGAHLTHTHIYMYMYIYMHTYIYMHVYIYMHTYM